MVIWVTIFVLLNKNISNSVSKNRVNFPVYVEYLYKIESLQKLKVKKKLKVIQATKINNKSIYKVKENII